MIQKPETNKPITENPVVVSTNISHKNAVIAMRGLLFWQIALTCISVFETHTNGNMQMEFFYYLYDGNTEAQGVKRALSMTMTSYWAR